MPLTSGQAKAASYQVEALRHGNWRLHERGKKDTGVIIVPHNHDIHVTHSSSSLHTMHAYNNPYKKEKVLALEVVVHMSLSKIRSSISQRCVLKVTQGTIRSEYNPSSILSTKTSS